MTGALSDGASRWFEKRGIDPETAAGLGCYTVESGQENVIVFPFREAGQEVGRKYRTREKRFWQDAPERRTFFNAEVLLDPTLRADKPNRLIITEGEIDCLTAVECGFPLAVSVPDGAPQKVTDQVPERDDDGKFAYVWNNWDALDQVKQIVLATDADGPGQVLAAELVRRLGAERCFFVAYPDGAKDLNEVLTRLGKAEVARLLNGAKPYPVKGLYRLSDFPEAPEPESYSTGWPNLDQHFRVQLGTFTVVTGIPSHGKALALDTAIPTPTGWTTMGDLVPGDLVLDDKGKACRVIAATPVMRDRDCYRIRFDDGTEVVADAEHQWFTTSEKARRSAKQTKLKLGNRERTLPRGTDQRHKKTYPGVVTTREIAGALWSQGKRNHHVQLTAPIEGVPSLLPIDPYTLGAWLGDGNSRDGRICDAEGYVVGRIAMNGRAIRQQRKSIMYGVEGLTAALRPLGLLNNKHIPKVYLRASEPQRWELLRGLMDTDGHCAKDYRCEFTTIRRRLADEVYELVSSLGIKAGICEGRAMLYGRDCGPKYRVCFVADRTVFAIQRKLARQALGRSNRRTIARIIVGCEQVPSVPVKCIEVDSPSRLYLCTRSFIPTHNSSVVNALIVNLIEQYGWTVAVGSFEEPPVPYHRDDFRRLFLRSDPRQATAEARAEADRKIGDHILFIAQSPADDDQEFDLEEILRLARVAVIRHGIKVLVLDPWNELEHRRYRDESETEYIGRAIRELKRFARRHEVAVIVVAHPVKMGSGKDGGVVCPTLYDISGSAAWYSKADVGIVVWRKDLRSAEVAIRVRKVRRRSIGKAGDLDMRFDEFTGRFDDDDYPLLNEAM